MTRVSPDEVVPGRHDHERYSECCCGYATADVHEHHRWLKERQATFTDEGYHGVAYHRAEIEARLAQAREAEAPVDPAYRELVDRTAEEQAKVFEPDLRSDFTMVLADPKAPNVARAAAGLVSSPESGDGMKKDAGKPRYDLIPVGPLRELARVYTIGAEKYGPRGWEPGMEWSRIVAAMQRHVEAWRGGEQLDPVDGQHHLSAVAWCAFALMEYEQTHPELDDRGVR